MNQEKENKAKSSHTKFWKIWVFHQNIAFSGFALSYLLFGIGQDAATFADRMVWLFSYVFAALVVTSLNYYLIKKDIFNWPKL